MLKWFSIIAPLLLGQLLAVEAVRAQPSPTASLMLMVNDRGTVSAKVSIIFSQVSSTQPNNNPPFKYPQNKQANQVNSGIWIIALPFDLDPNKKITSAADVHIAQLVSGRGYTLLALTKPPTLPETTFEIGERPLLTETPDGKAKLELNTAFPNMSQVDKELISTVASVKEYQLTIILPKKYDIADVNQHPTFHRSDDVTYSITVEQYKQMPNAMIWISFPNPMQRNLEIAKFIGALLIGIFTLVIQYPLFKEKRVKWFVTVFLLSLAVLSFITYFGIGLAKRMEFLISVAVVIPNAIYAFIASIYLLLAKRYQATITGQVRVNNAPGRYVHVELVRNDNGKLIVVKQTEELKDDGRFYFFIWGKELPEKYQINAKYNAIESRSGEFDVKKGDKLDVPPIDFDFRSDIRS